MRTTCSTVHIVWWLGLLAWTFDHAASNCSRTHVPVPSSIHFNILAAKGALAEQSKAVAQGAIPKGCGFEPHRRHFDNALLNPIPNSINFNELPTPNAMHFNEPPNLRFNEFQCAPNPHFNEFL